MRKFILLTSFAVVSARLYGMQGDFNNKMNAEEMNIHRPPLAFSDDSDSQDTILNKKENSSSSIQWDIFENQEKSNQKTRGDIFSDSSDSTYLPSVDEIFKEILNPKGKTEQLEVSDNPIQTQIELPEASGDIVRLPRKNSDQLSIVGDKRKASETDDAEEDSPEKKRIKTSSYKENDSKDTIIIEKENSPKNRNKKKYFARKTGLKTPEFELLMKIENAEDRIEELQNLVLKKEDEFELERSNHQNSITQRIEIEKKNKELSKQIDFLKQQISILQTSEEESKRQKEQLNLKITEQNEKIANLNHLLQSKGTEFQRVQQENNNKVAKLTEQLNTEKMKEPGLIFSWNQLLSRLKSVQQREQGIQSREGFWNSLLMNKDNQIKTLSAQLQQFQIEKNNIFAQQRQSQARVANLTTQLQQSQAKVTNLTEQLQQSRTETINLTNRLQETQREAQNTLQIKNQELANLKVKLEMRSVKQEVDQNQQTNNKFEYLYKQTERRLKETEKSLKGSRNEICKIQDKYVTELNKKEGYKSEVNRLNQILLDKQIKAKQQKTENEQANSTLTGILLGERRWQNVLKPLNASQKKNEDLREYLLRLMKHSSTRSLVNRFNKDEYSKEIVQQLTYNMGIKEHPKMLGINQYYWLTSKINEEREIFSKSNGYDESLLKKLKDRNDRAQKQLDKIDKDNEFLMQIILELKKDKDIASYIRDSFELHQSALTAKIDRYLTQNKSVKDQ